VKFRRKSATDPVESTDPATPEADDVTDAETPDSAQRTDQPLAGPWDADDLPAEVAEVERADLGALLILPVEGKEIRLQVDESNGEVAAVLIADEEGAVELRAFAAPRNADMWSEVLPQLEADVVARGGVHQRHDGAWGPELLCQLQVQMPDGEQGVQPSRIVGVNGPRWLLRATFLGRPAVDAASGAEWEQILRQVVVRRGRTAMPKGEALPMVLPQSARRA
jgi:hypothetical protein